MTKFPRTTQQYLKLIIIITETLKKNNTYIYSFPIYFVFIFYDEITNMNNFFIRNEKFHVMQ